MPGPGFLIGVVTHEGSGFPEAATEGGAAARLAAALGARGAGTEIQVVREDLWTGQATPAMVQASLDAQLALEAAWGRFLGRSRTASWQIEQALRTLGRARRRVSPPAPAMVRRLLNIELAHLTLLRAGVASRAEVTVVLEDDAVLEDPDDAARGLLGLLELDWGYASVSASFGSRHLHVGGLLSPAGPWAGTRPRRVLRSSLPVTDTVCAVAYRKAFLPGLVEALDAVPQQPVLPIDWKLNAALMAMAARADLSGACLLVEPGPFRQGSMG